MTVRYGSGSVTTLRLSDSDRNMGAELHSLYGLHALFINYVYFMKNTK